MQHCKATYPSQFFFFFNQHATKSKDHLGRRKAFHREVAWVAIYDVQTGDGESVEGDRESCFFMNFGDTVSPGVEKTATGSLPVL